MSAAHRLTLDLDAEFGHADVTAEVAEAVRAQGVETGIVCVQLVGSTGGVTTIEYEPGALDDLRRALEAIAPAGGRYAHDERWHDGNGFSHLRSALVKTGVAVPVVDGALQLGTWQQIVALNFDNKRRRRELVVIAVGS